MSWWSNKYAYKGLYLAGFLFIAGLSLFYYRSAGEAEQWWPPILPKDVAENNLLPVITEASSKPPLVILFGGDVMLSRTVNAKMALYNDYLWPWREIASTTAAADLTVFNLESPFLKEADYRVPTGSFLFKANPLSADGLVFGGTDLVSLANNHILNMGEPGLRDTLQILEEHDIAAVGAGKNFKEAHSGVLLTSGQWKVAFLAYAYPNDNSVADEDSPGITTMNITDLTNDIARWCSQADLVIILMHAGREYVARPGAEQIAFAHAAVAAGADAVIGHHPHWPQSAEVYLGKPIIYSLGNFIFDHMWSQETSGGVMARLTFQEDLSGRAELLPITIKDYGQVRPWPQLQPLTDFWSQYDLKVSTDLVWPEPIEL